MKVLLNRNVIHLIYSYLRSLPLNTNYNKFFTFYVNLNLKHLENEFMCVEALKMSINPSKEYIEFMSKKNSLNQECLVIEDGTTSLKPEHADYYNETYKKLIEEYREDIIEFDSYSNEVGTFLNETSEVEISPIPFKYFPKELSLEQYDVLKYLRKETDQEVMELEK